MKIFPVAEVRALDAYTIAHEPIASADLMERAGENCCRWLLARMPADKPYAVFCGMGNNGGDGLVIARLLAQKRRKVRVFVLKTREKGSADFEIMLQRLQKNPKIEISELRAGTADFETDPQTIIVDALFGSGLSKALEGEAALLADKLNSAPAFAKIAIDIPSGLFGEENPRGATVFRASHTLSLQFPKLSFLFAENAGYVGDWTVVPIGIHPDAIAGTFSSWALTEAADVKLMLCPRMRFSHKGDYGHALLIAGSRGKCGAAILSAEACLRSGAGLLSCRLPACGMNPLLTALPEAMTETDAEEDIVTSFPPLQPYNAIGAGPGLGKDERTAGMLKLLIQEARVPLVLDADALNILGDNKTWLAFLPPDTILTPHPKEFDRMAGSSANAFERWQKQVDFSKRFGVYVLLKGAFTCISTPDGRSFFNSSGCPGMATAGSGDVLTGIILGLLSRGYAPGQAALISAYIHGLAGEVAEKRYSAEGMTAGDIIRSLGKAWNYLY